MADIDFSSLMKGTPIKSKSDKKVPVKSIIGVGTTKDAKRKTNIDFSGLMDKKSPEPMSDDQNEDFVQRILSAPDRVADVIDKRGSLWSQYTADNSAIGVGKTFLQNISIPSRLLESGISNPVLEMQRGNLNPIDLLSESVKGFSGLKMGEYGDVAKQAGATDPLAGILGFGYSMIAPIALIGAGKNAVAATRFADSRIRKAIISFFNTVKKSGGAMNKVGGKVGAYYDDIGAAAVNQGKFFDETINMTTSIKKSVADMPAGKLVQVEDELINLVEKGNVHAVHKAKEVIDDLITSYYTSTSKTQKLLRGHSKNLGNIIDDAAFNAKKVQLGKKGAAKYVKNFRKARKDYSELKSGFDFIKKKLINPQTGNPTQTGSILREISDPREINLRSVLADLNRFGTKSNKFANELMSIDRAIKNREFFSRVVQGAGYGIAVGTAIGQTVGRARNENMPEE